MRSSEGSKAGITVKKKKEKVGGKRGSDAQTSVMYFFRPSSYSL